MSVDDYVPTKPSIKQELGGLVVQLSGRAHMSVTRYIPDTKTIQKLLSPSSRALVVISALLALNSTETGKHMVHSNHSEGYTVVSDKLCLEMAFLSSGGAPFIPARGEAKTGGSFCVIEASLVYKTTSRTPTVTEKPCFNPRLKRKMTF